MRTEFVYDFGVMPDDVLLGSRIPTPHESNVRWKLELWREDEGWQLRHNQATIKISDLDGLILRCDFARRARGSGYTHVDLRCPSNMRSTISLLNGRFEDLEWLRSTARTLVYVWDIVYEERDYGDDD